MARERTPIRLIKHDKGVHQALDRIAIHADRLYVAARESDRNAKESYNAIRREIIRILNYSGDPWLTKFRTPPCVVRAWKEHGIGEEESL